MRLMSGSGPCGPILNGVWQSLQAEVMTKCSPRWISAARWSAALGAGLGAAAGFAATGFVAVSVGIDCGSYTPVDTEPALIASSGVGRSRQAQMAQEAMTMVMKDDGLFMGAPSSRWWARVI